MSFSSCKARARALLSAWMPFSRTRLLVCHYMWEIKKNEHWTNCDTGNQSILLGPMTLVDEGSSAFPSPIRFLLLFHSFFQVGLTPPERLSQGPGRLLPSQITEVKHSQQRRRQGTSGGEEAEGLRGCQEPLASGPGPAAPAGPTAAGPTRETRRLPGGRPQPPQPPWQADPEPLPQGTSALRLPAGLCVCARVSRVVVFLRSA